MIDPADFETLVARAMAEPGRQAMRPVIEKELLHFDILFALDREGLLDDLTFQGGTSLRLCYGASRFSEDLDFAGGRDFQSDRVAAIKACIETYVSRRYRLEVTVKPPRVLRHEPAYAEVKVDKWQVAVVTSPSRPDLPKQRIKLEIANIPAHTRQARNLQVHYPFLPDGYSDLLVLCESLDEILADKLVSLVNTQKYVRHRDIWDLQWLKQQGATPNIGLVTQKLRDYRVEDYLGKATAMIDRLPEIIGGDAFRHEMTRFLPADTLERTLLRAKFTDFLCRELSETLGAVVSELEGASPPSQEFRL
ncbi:nucleotidyl transferase AbiEii/AbiGii toxin family protein [Halomonas sp. 328]|uniref:nucleotidyl transferase AbiEii/AbiGii toxin family protein n=1 Tax=Halomonas sp. 328 TaxID=2776704 RepID=UPI0018A706A5|nr:nucleotidyl transferase AbiEii/AbiGii toxin family protein [Halomonas sp. 328]MBF8222279.1 nucleotidyl transferase AbiEii/AbiGii toxin family protein [Halomonas sp. 328]